MTVGVGAGGFLGIAPETVAGTYVAPTKYVLLRNESLNYVEDVVQRRPLRGIADVAGIIHGNSRIEGDINIEVTEDQLPHLFKGMRGTVAKTGATAPFTYVFTPNPNALPNKTLSITVVRNGIAFGYTGCVIGSQEYTIDNGLLVATYSLVGLDEADQSVPTPTYVTGDPFGAGQYDIEIPTSTAVFDTDTFTFQVEDNAEAQYRLKSTGRGAQFVKYGEREVTLSVERDFESRTDYDAFKALTARDITVRAIKSASQKVEFHLPKAVQESYPISGLSGQADLIRATQTWRGTYDAVSSKSFEITAVTSEDVTFP